MTLHHSGSEPALIATSDALAQACARLAQEPFLAVDTEFMRDGTYWARLCLVQIGGERETILIDACARDLDLAPLRDLMADMAVRKVFHAAGQDVGIFLKLFGFVPNNLFDTQIAARVLGHGEQAGYSALAKDVLDVSLAKDERFTDWSRRPLTPAQLAYAANDVIYLRRIYQKLLADLRARGRLDWIEREIAEAFTPETLIQDPWSLWRKIRLRSSDRRVLGRLRHLAAWREERARKDDVARTRILRDDVLAQIALAAPQKPHELENVRGVRPGWARGRHGEEVMACLAEADALPPEELPKIEEKPLAPLAPAQEAQMALLKVVLGLRAAREDVVPRMLASSDELKRLIGGARDLPMLRGWKGDAFGRLAADILDGRACVGLKDGNVVCFPVSKDAQEALD